MGSRKGRSAQDALGHLLAWVDLTSRERSRIAVGFFDVKGGFQNVKWEGIRYAAELQGLKRWAPWLGEFCKARNIIMSWDGVDRGEIRVEKGVPQGSPLSPILFLLYVADMMREIETSLRRDLATRIGVVSYVDDMAVIAPRVGGNPEAVRLLIENTVYERARAHEVEMALEKTEWLLPTGGGKKNVKWLVVDINRNADPASHWKVRLSRAWGALRAVNLLGNSAKGLSPRSWNLLSRGMVATTLMWGSDVLCTDKTKKVAAQTRKL